MRFAATHGEFVLLRLCRWAPLALLVCVAISAASPARAFNDPEFFHEEPKFGGSDGRWFTGAPPDGFGCSVCHSGKPAERVVLEGLPMDGYAPGETYNIRITWPDVANRTRDLYVTQPADSWPRAALVAEFASETGESGFIKQGTVAGSRPTDLCRKSTPRERGRYGYAIYRKTVDEVGEPLSDTWKVNDCLGENFTRCLVAVRACGAEEARFQWTAPEENQGAIWFALGFVATDVQDRRPEQDAVTEIAIPIPPLASTGYQMTLGQSCGVHGRAGAGANTSAAPLAWLAAIGLGLALRTRSRRRGGCP